MDTYLPMVQIAFNLLLDQQETRKSASQVVHAGHG
jgi:hypothetical protein